MYLLSSLKTGTGVVVVSYPVVLPLKHREEALGLAGFKYIYSLPRRPEYTFSEDERLLTGITQCAVCLL